MKNTAKTAKKEARQDMIGGFIETWRSILEASHDKVVFLGHHRRRNRVKFLCDGKVVMRDPRDYRIEDDNPTEFMSLETAMEAEGINGQDLIELKYQPEIIS